MPLSPQPPARGSRAYFWLRLTTFGVLVGGALLITWTLVGRNSLERLEQQLNEIRDIHHDLDQGMLHVMLADETDGPFQRDAGIAFFRQSLNRLEKHHLVIAALADAGASPLLSDLSADIRLFARLIDTVPTESPGLSAADRARLRTAFHRLTRHLHRAETLARGALRDHTGHLEQRVLISALLAAVLLIGLILGAVKTIRRLTADAAHIRSRETLIRNIGDNLPDAYVYQWQRHADAPPRFTHLSRGVERVHGIAHAAALADASVLLEQLSAASRSRLFAAEAHHGRELRPLEIEVPFVRADGETRTLQLRARPQSLADGTLQWDGIAADITDQKHREIAHREIDADLHEISELAHIGTWSFDPITGDGYWSDEVAHIHDLSPHDPASRDIGLLYYPEPWLSHIKQAIDDAVQHARPYELELCMHTAAKRTKWVRVLGFPVVRQGEVLRVRGTIQDITERKLARIDLAQREAQFRLLFEEAADGMLILSRDNRVREINQHLLELLGRERSEVLSLPLSDLVNLADRDRLRESLRSIDTGAVDLIEVQFRTADGTFVETEIGIRRLSDERTVCIVRDVTRRRRAERRSALQVAVTSALARGVRLDESADQVIELFCEYLNWDYGVYRRVNGGRTHLVYVAHWFAHDADLSDLSDHHREAPLPRGEDFAGRIWQKQQALWENLGDLDETTRTGAEVRLLLKLGVQSRLGFPVILRDSTLGIFEFYSRRRQSPRPELLNFLVGLGTQFGLYLERLRLDQSVLQAQKMEAIGTLAGGIAHDFNNLLSAILGHTDLALYSLDQPAEASDNLQQVKQASSRASALVRQLLTFSRGPDAETTERRAPVSIEKMVAETVSFLRATVPPTVRIANRIPAELPPIHADATQVQQVLMNLGTNAWHAMGDQPGTLAFAARFIQIERNRQARHILAPGPYLHLTITDTGKGMDAATRERIFEPFFTTKERTGGTGLGLSVVHAIMLAHGGSISVESELGLGTTFHLHFPVSPSAATPSPAAAETVAPSPSGLVEQLRGNGETILLVEDESSVARPVQRLLERARYRIELCFDPQTALRLFRADPGRFDLLLTDYAMPEFDGLELVRRVKELRPNLPAVLTTGLADSLNKKEINDAGVDALLAKPATTQRLLQVVHDTLHDRAADA